MTTENMSEIESDRKKQIVGVARGLFARLGWEKVTMNDIAQHVGTSKASLYYYFTDKESLFRAVVESEQQEFLDGMAASLSEKRSACWQLQHYAELRHHLFRELLNLGKLRVSSPAGIRPLFKDLLAGLREREMVMIEQILWQGRKSGELRVSDVREMAELFLNIMQGLRMHHTGAPHFSDEDQESLHNEIILFVKVFTNGIRKN
jgi:TetR/AcrR family transcriptional repressor of mexJK operon